MLKPRAFTLIEILACISIVSILTAIAFPVLAKVKDSTRMTNCQSNVRQIGTAIMLYVHDYDDYLPIAVNPFSKDDTVLPRRLKPYINNNEVFRCPSDVNNSNMIFKGTYFDNIQMSYQYLLENFTPNPIHLSGISHPSSAFLVADQEGFHGNGLWNILYADLHTHYANKEERQKSLEYLDELKK